MTAILTFIKRFVQKYKRILVTELQWWEWGELFVFVFSITDKHSFKVIDSYWNEISSFKKVKRIPMVIVGTQGTFTFYCFWSSPPFPDDLENKRQVTFGEGDALALRYQCPFLEVAFKNEKLRV